MSDDDDTKLRIGDPRSEALLAEADVRAATRANLEMLCGYLGSRLDADPIAHHAALLVMREQIDAALEPDAHGPIDPDELAVAVELLHEDLR